MYLWATGHVFRNVLSCVIRPSIPNLPLSMATGLSVSNPGIRWMRNPSDLQISTPFSQFGGLESKHGKNEFYFARNLHSLSQYWQHLSFSSPGRFYALFTIKTVFTHILHNYDVELTDQNTSRTFSWRSATVPYSNSTIRVRQRRDWGTGLDHILYTID